MLPISHRYNTVCDADHIYVLDHGRIIEHGDHNQLMTAGGVYAELFTLQARRVVSGRRRQAHNRQCCP